MSHVEKLLDESRVAIYKKQNSGDLWQAPLVKLFQVPFTPSNIKPNNDYYTYVNFRWLQNTENEFDSKGKPKNRKYFSQIDNFRLVQDKTYRDVLNLVNEYVKKNSSFTISNIEQGDYKIKVFYGNDWNPELENSCGTKGNFESDVNFSEFDGTEYFTDNESGYTNATITLYTVQGGNASSSDIDQSQFFKK